MALNSQENTCARVSSLINMQASASNSGGCFLATDDLLDFNDFLFLTSSFNTTKHTFNKYMEGSNKRSKYVCC